MKSRQYAARQKIRYLLRQGITRTKKRQAIAVLKGDNPYNTVHENL